MIDELISTNYNKLKENFKQTSQISDHGIYQIKKNE